MTHDDLVQRAVRWLRNTRKCPVVLAEYTSALPVIPDAIGFWRAHSILVECKVSRADFRADRHKPSHRGGWGPGRERWYMTPPGLVRPDEVPEGWGLLEAHARIVRRIVEPSVRHEDSVRYDMEMLVSAMRRHQLGIVWHKDTARFEPYNQRTP